MDKNIKYSNALKPAKLFVFNRQDQPGRVGKLRIYLLIACFVLNSVLGFAQNSDPNGSNQYLSLGDCISYALKHQPALNQSLINISIAKTTNAINLSGWLPQVNLLANLVHYDELPTNFIANTTNPGGPPVQTHTGVVNTSIPELSVTQALFSPTLLYAAKSAPLYVKQAELMTDSTKINIVSSVSKAFYSLLLTVEQINVYKEDTSRLAKNLKDTYYQYKGGIVDETDYDEAAISLNNSKAQLTQAMQNVVPQYAGLKQLMGYPPERQFNISFDTAQIKKDILVDTTQQLQYDKRIEFIQLATARELQHRLIGYYQLAFLPTISAYYNYNYEFESSTFSNLYNTAYPYSLIGLTLNIPLFTGFSRIENVHKARLQEQIIDWSEVDLKEQINVQYTTALASYKSNLYNLYALQDNVALATKVYTIVNLQYKQGIVDYLHVITAESNLITSEIGYLNALFQVLSNKIDLAKAMGAISY